MTYSSHHRAALFALFFVIFIDSTSYGLVIPIFLRLLMGHDPVFMLHVSEHTRNLLFSLGIALGPLMYFLGAPLMGRLSDQLGRKKTLIYALLATLFGFLLSVFGILYHSFLWLLIGRAASGFGSSSQPIAQAALMDISKGKAKAQSLSLIAFAMTLAMVAGPSLGGFLSDPTLVSWFNASTPFIAASFLVIICMLFIKFGFSETYGYRCPVQLSWHVVHESLKLIFKQANARTLLIIFFMYELSWSLYFQYISLFLSHTYHYDTNLIALFIAYLGLAMSAGLIFGYRIVLRWLSPKQCMHWMLFLNALGLILCAVLPGLTTQWVCSALVALATGMAYPSILAVLSDQFGVRDQGWLMGAAMSSMALAWLLSAFMMGVLGNIWIVLPLFIAAAIMVLSFLLTRSLTTRKTNNAFMS